MAEAAHKRAVRDCHGNTMIILTILIMKIYIYIIQLTFHDLML
jgi:hypothetical protein